MTILIPGTMLQERYRIVGPIGQGGMGAVYEAVQERLKRRVAVKQLLNVGEAHHNRAFLREAQILAHLEHASLPDIIDYFTDDAGHFLVMDFVPGDDLAVQLARRGAPFPTDTVMQWADQVLDVLDYLHTQRPEPIYHRDIKPQNLKLKPNGEIILLDFGLAKGYLGEMTHVTGGDSLVGYSAGFSPPEQVEGKGTDARSDLYALGATLHRLLTNTPPVDERSRWRAAARGQLDPLRPVHELNPRVPTAVSKVLIQALDLEPEGRPASAAAMHAALREVGSRRRLQPPTISPMLRIGRQFFQSVSSLGSRTPAIPPTVKLPRTPTLSGVQPPVASAEAIESELTQVDASVIETRDGEAEVGGASANPFPKEVPHAAVSHMQPDTKIDMPTAVPDGSLPAASSPQTPKAADTSARAGAETARAASNSLIPAADPDAQLIGASATVLPSPLTEQVVPAGQSTAKDSTSLVLPPAVPPSSYNETESMEAGNRVQLVPVDNNIVGEPAPQDNHHLDDRNRLTSDDLSATTHGETAKSIDVMHAVAPTLISDAETSSGLHSQQPSIFVQKVIDRDPIDVPHENMVPGLTESSPDTPVVSHGSAGESKPSLLSSVDFAGVDPAPLIADTELAEVATLQSPGASFAHNPVASDRQKQPDERIGGAPKMMTPATMVEPKPWLKQANFWAIRGTVVLLVLLVGLSSAVVSSWVRRGPSTTPTGFSRPSASIVAADTNPTPRDTAVASSSGSQIAEATTTPTILPTSTAVAIRCDDDQTPPSKTGSAEDYFKNGEAALKAKLFPKAIREYTWAIKLDPQSVEAYISRGQAYHMLAKYTCAIEDYNQALEINPQSSVAYNFRGNVYAVQAKNDLAKANSAIEDYTRAIEINPDYIAAYFNRSLVHDLKGTAEEKELAIADLKEVVKSNHPILRPQAEEKLQELTAPLIVTATS